MSEPTYYPDPSAHPGSAHFHGDILSEAVHHHPNYVAVWVWLVLLAGFSVVLSSLPLSHPITLLLIFEIAVIKALLVAVYFMHLKFERSLIYSMITAPLICFGILILVLFPEIAFYGGGAIHQATGGAH